MSEKKRETKTAVIQFRITPTVENAAWEAIKDSLGASSPDELARELIPFWPITAISRRGLLRQNTSQSCRIMPKKNNDVAAQ